MHHYTYMLKCIDTNQFYIGKRSSKVSPEKDCYWSSSKTVKAMMHKGMKFTKEILQEFDTAVEALEHEIALHEYHDVIRNPLFLNKSKQTSKGFDTTGVPLSKERRDKLNAVNRKRLLEGTHNWIGNTKASDSLAKGTHNFQLNNYSKKRYEKGNHNFQLHRKEYVEKQMRDGTFNFIKDHPMKHRYLCRSCGKRNTKTVFSRNFKDCLPFIERIL